MAIVPSGTRRLMKLQQAAPTGANPPARKGIEQENLGGPQGQPAGDGFNPMQKLDDTLQQQKQQPAAAPQVPDQAQLDEAVQPPQEQAKSSDQTTEESDFKDAVFDAMTQLGVDKGRIGLAKRDAKYFQSSYDQKGLTGWFLVPGRLSQQKIFQFYSPIAKKFGLFVQKVEHFQVSGGGDKGGGIGKVQYNKVTFSGHDPNEAPMNMDVDFPDASAPTSGGGPGGSPGLERAAYSKDAIIKESRSSIVNSLIKQGFGGKQ